ncbi:MAG: ATP synthase subunit I [Calditerrivibrio sp.]|nr:ATP synthase subunit I [Calditerrivibrio sp.]
MKKNKLYQKILIFSLIFFVILYTVCNMFLGETFGTNMIVGYLLSVLNFVGLSYKIQKSFDGSFVGIGIGNTFLRLLLVGFFLYLWFKKGDLNVWGLIVGLSVLTVSIPAYIFLENRRKTDGTPA